jgi:hypothetical protein
MSPTPPFLPGKQLSNVYAFLLFEKYKFMLTFKPLKTKALITQCIIRQKRSFFKHRRIPVKLPFNRACFHANIKNSFDDIFFDDAFLI